MAAKFKDSMAATFKNQFIFIDSFISRLFNCVLELNQADFIVRISRKN